MGNGHGRRGCVTGTIGAKIITAHNGPDPWTKGQSLISHGGYLIPTHFPRSGSCLVKSSPSLFFFGSTDAIRFSFHLKVVVRAGDKTTQIKPWLRFYGNCMAPCFCCFVYYAMGQFDTSANCDTSSLVVEETSQGLLFRNGPLPSKRSFVSKAMIHWVICQSSDQITQRASIVHSRTRGPLATLTSINPRDSNSFSFSPRRSSSLCRCAIQ